MTMAKKMKTATPPPAPACLSALEAMPDPTHAVLSSMLGLHDQCHRALSSVSKTMLSLHGGSISVLDLNCEELAGDTNLEAVCRLVKRQHRLERVVLWAPEFLPDGGRLLLSLPFPHLEELSVDGEGVSAEAKTFLGALADALQPPGAWAALRCLRILVADGPHGMLEPLTRALALPGVAPQLCLLDVGTGPFQDEDLVGLTHMLTKRASGLSVLKGEGLWQDEDTSLASRTNLLAALLPFATELEAFVWHDAFQPFFLDGSARHLRCWGLKDGGKHDLFSSQAVWQATPGLEELVLENFDEVPSLVKALNDGVALLHLRHLHFVSCEMKATTWARMLEAVAASPCALHLESVKVEECTWGKATMALFLHHLGQRTFPKLTHLSFSGTINEAGLVALAEGLLSAQPLAILDVSNVPMGDKGRRALADAQSEGRIAHLEA